MGKRTFKAAGVVVTLDDSLSKADIARRLLDEGLSVSLIAKLVPMAYSQVHSISKKIEGDKGLPSGNAKATVERAQARNPLATPQQREAKARELSGLQNVCRPDIDYHARPHSAGCLKGIKADNNKRRKEVAHAAVGMKPSRSQVHALGQSPRVGKLRTPGLPTDTVAGPCANCGYELVIRGSSNGWVLIHTGVSAEEYMATIQFCQAVPQLLLHKR